MHNDSVKEKFIELRANGNSLDKISSMIGVSKPTLIKWSREFNIEISNMRALALDSLREKYLLSQEARVKRLALVIEKIEANLEKTSSIDLKFDVAVKLLLSTQDLLDKELKVNFMDKSDFVF